MLIIEQKANEERKHVSKPKSLLSTGFGSKEYMYLYIRASALYIRA